MTYTLVPVSRTYTDGATPRTGTVRLQLTGPMVNQGEIADCQPQILTLNAQGTVSALVRATNDPATTPVGGSALQVTETLSGLITDTYVIAVPYDGGPIDLATAPRLTGDAIPAPAHVMQPVNERGLPGGYPVLDGGGRVPRTQLPADLGGGGGTGVAISGNDTDIKPLGTRAAGASGLAADASHVHATPTMNQVGAPTAAVPFGNQRLINLSDGVGPQDAATVAQLGQSVLGWFNVKDKAYGAKGDGTTDDTAAIQAAIDACPAGGIVYFPQGVYRTSAPLYPKPGVVLQGAHASLMAGLNLTDPACYIQPLPTFTGSALLILKDQASGGYASLPAEHRLFDLMLDGSTLDGTNPIDGIYAAGNIQNVVMRNVTVRKMSNNGLVTAGVDNVFPYSWRMHSVMVDNCRGNGILFTRLTDLTMIDVQVIGCWATGMKLSNIANSEMVVCRAEWNGNHGYWLTGAWGTGTGSGGAVMAACATDRNGWDGVHVDATGNAPLTLDALMTRRDGRNGGSGGAGYAGLNIKNTTMPVIIDGASCYPGTDDDGTGASSPDFGASISGSTYVQINGGSLHGFLGGLSNDGTSTSVTVSPGTILASGTTAAPVRLVQPSAVDWLNVRRYGAKGDGITDDTAALQAAVNAAATAKTAVYIPQGTYLVSTPIVLPAGQGLSIIGGGWSSSVKLKAASNCFVFKMTGADTRVTIRDLTIDGNCLEQGTTGTSGGIDGSGAVACRFDNIHFVACRDDALYLGGMTGGAFGHNNRAIGCLFDESMTSTGPGRGIQMNSNDENQIVACDFEYLGGSGGTGFGTAVAVLDRAGTQFITACNFVGGATNNTKGVRIQDASSTKITGSNFDGTAGDSIFIAGSLNSVVGNTIFSPGEVGTAGQASGIHLEYAAVRNQIQSNSIVSSPINGQTRSLIREEASGNAGQNQITGNTLTVKGTLATALTEFQGAASVTRNNLGAPGSLIADRSAIYVPSDWGKFWRPKRDAAATGGKAKIIVVGGSSSQGFYASNLHTGGWVGNLRTALQTKYGNGGSGFFSTSRSAVKISSPSDAAAVTAWTANGSLATTTGTWSLGGSLFGPGFTYIYADTTGASVTFGVTGSTVKIYTVSGSGARPSFTYTIDGGAPVTVPDSGIGASNIQVTTVTGLTAAAHTVVVTWAGTATGTGQNLSVAGVSGENGSGIVIDNNAKAGAASSSFVTNTVNTSASSTLGASFNGGVDNPCDLLIFTAGPNDAAANVSGDVWQNNVSKYMKIVKDTGAADGATDILFVVPHLGVHDITNFVYSEYANRARMLADTYGGAVINLWNIGRNSWKYWDNLGYWGDANVPGAVGHDSVHPNDTGYAYITQHLLSVVDS